jgi:hypothetical protein
MASDIAQVTDSQRPLLADHVEGSEYGTAQDPAPVRNATGTFARNLGTTEAFGIVISIVIGSGVFTSPGAIDSNVPSPGIALVIWLVGGILAWTGASTMAELGTAIPGEGNSLTSLYITSRVNDCARRWCPAISTVHLW